jgi:hypothetical protein
MPRPFPAGTRCRRFAGLRATEARTAFHERVLDAVRAFLQAQAMADKTGARDFNEVEKALHGGCSRPSVRSRGRHERVGHGRGGDRDRGQVHRRVLRSRQTYKTAAGEVQLERWL